MEIVAVMSTRITLSANHSANNPLAAARPPQTEKPLIMINHIEF